MSQQTFANFIGINAASLSSIFNNRTKPTLNTVEAIKSKIPNLNTDWLMFGHGSMFESDDKVEADRTSENDTGRGVMYSGAEGGMPDLFSDNGDQGMQNMQQRHREATIRPEVRYVERPQRQITEIRVYFDDLTYESFVPKK